MRLVLLLLFLFTNVLNAQPLFELGHVSKSMHFSDIIKHENYYYVLGETRFINPFGSSTLIEGTISSGYYIAKIDLDFKVKATTFFEYNDFDDLFLVSHDCQFFKFTDTTVVVTYNKNMGNLNCDSSPINLGMNWCRVPYYGRFNINNLSFFDAFPVSINDYVCESERIPKTILSNDTTYYLGLNENKYGLNKLNLNLIQSSNFSSDTLYSFTCLLQSWNMPIIVQSDDSCFVFTQRDSIQNNTFFFRLDKKGNPIDSISFAYDSTYFYNLFNYKFDYPYYFYSYSELSPDSTWDSRAIYFNSNTLHSLYFENLNVLDWKVKDNFIYLLGIKTDEPDDLDEFANNSNSIEIIKLNPITNNFQTQKINIPNYQDAKLKVFDNKLILIREENIGEYENTLHSKIVFDVIDEKFENNNANIFLCYPNPASDMVSVKSEYPLEQILVYNQLGQLVFKTIPNHTSATFSIKHLPSGMYLINTLSEARWHGFKLIVEH